VSAIILIIENDRSRAKSTVDSMIVVDKQ